MPSTSRWVATAVVVLIGLSGCATEAWKEVEPDPVAAALLDDSGLGSSEGDLVGRRLGVLLSVARQERGEPYEWGADGPTVWDCSSFVRHAYSEVGIRMPRTARAQRDWMADGNGVLIAEGDEQPGDLVFWDDYLGPDAIGHVAMVWDPDESSTIEARTPETGFYRYKSAEDHSMFEIWRATDLAPPAA